ncbi:hypothetical protein SteCoe_24644 [Stentor coeruleus]|uniref:CHCH domain-containing protein n=1 Tax=Stentor coeruleus TaxID=5963 RepID=A0A1R2BH59_9CILI|nr:hypothetical protein SteCoe_24644 [Stentor coeruleus]
MAEDKWNFLANPPIVGSIDNEYYNKELIGSVRAFYACGKVAKALADCRKRPEGRFVHPEKCESHARAVVDCYQEVRNAPATCASPYEKTFECLQKGGSCASLLEDYVKCEHPAAKKYN